MSDSDSSDNSEEIKYLQEAIDPEFKNYHKIKSKLNGKIPESQLSVNKTHCDRSELNLSEESKSFIAKKLSESLDRSIREVEVSNSSPSKDTTENGIKLFTSSTKFCTSSDNDDEKIPPKRRKTRKSNKISTSNLSSVVVTSDWVLEKRGVYEFPRPKNQTIIYPEKKKKPLQFL